jgi:hypothetical protein
VGGTSRKYAFDRLALHVLWPIQEKTNLIQIEVLALEDVIFFVFEKPICPFVNPVGVTISAPKKFPPRCAPQNCFNDGIFTHVYKPLDLNAWPKSRDGRKILQLGTFKLSILQEIKWQVG